MNELQPPEPRERRIKEHWLTRQPTPQAWLATLVLFFLLYGVQALYEANIGGLQSLLMATQEQVFQQHQYWRLWTALFVHADFGHIASNSLLFFPLAYYLYGYYGFWLFPFLGIFLGGLINVFVLLGLPPQTNLLGISGVVYWMAAVWSALYLMLERRDSWRRRVAKVALITVVLLVPETYRPEVSYVSHFWGYVVGIIVGLIWFRVHRRHFRAAEVYEEIPAETETEIEVKIELDVDPEASKS